MYKIICFIAALHFSAAFSQQLHFTSMYMQHNSMYNPAAAGMNSGKALIGASYRNQWTNFPGNPKTMMLYTDVDWKKMNAGIGGYLYHDVTGPTTRTALQLAYSYHVKTAAADNHKLGLGIELRGINFALDKSKVADALVNDPVLNGSSSKFVLDAGAGAYYTDGSFSAGVSVSQLIQSKLDLADVKNATLRAKLYRHYTLIANYKFHADADFDIIPNAMVRLIEHSPTEWDFGCKVDYKNKIWWNLVWRVRQFWSAQAGFKISNKVGIGYCYDYYETPINTFTDKYHSHEFSLQFDLR